MQSLIAKVSVTGSEGLSGRIAKTMLCYVVPRGGIEPPACPLGGDRSIQLSYRGNKVILP